MPTAPYTNWSTAATTISGCCGCCQRGPSYPGLLMVFRSSRVPVGARDEQPGRGDRVGYYPPERERAGADDDSRGVQVPGTTDWAWRGPMRLSRRQKRALSSGSTLTTLTLASVDEYNLQSGCIIRAGSQWVVVTNCVLRANSASWYGGGVYRLRHEREQQALLHAWDVAGDYVVTLTAYNEDHPEGIAASLTMHVQTTPTHFVMLGSINPVAPYQSWDTAAGDVQRPVDAANGPGARVIVGDGVYEGSLDHCTLSPPPAKWGGGAYGSLLTECVLTGNSASSLGSAGGSALLAVLRPLYAGGQWQQRGLGAVG